MTSLIRRVWSVILLAFTLLYLILRPLARYLLFSVEVSPSVYTVVIYSALVLAAVAVVLLVMAMTGIRGRRLATTGSVAAVAGMVVCILTGAAIYSLVGDDMWAYTEPASLTWMLVWATEFVVVAWLVSRYSVLYAHV